MSTYDRSEQALELVTGFQKSFVTRLEKYSTDARSPLRFEKVEWQRNEGKNGGGSRYFSASNRVFNRASVNVSHIHYDDDPAKKLASATALSAIIHPENPHAPSLHTHISWTEIKGQGGYWRVMADLNPSIANEEDRQTLLDTFHSVASSQCEEALAQGDKYFYIPALERHRGVVHFYLEQYRTDDTRADYEMASRFGEAVIQCYGDLLTKYISVNITDSDREAQLAYHSLYLLQVLTLDRGTTSGLLVHNQNDLGIMGSLPSRVNRALLQSWVKLMDEKQSLLLEKIITAIPDEGEVSDSVRLRLAQTVREHYQKYPEALCNQASGNVVPPTVNNHR